MKKKVFLILGSLIVSFTAIVLINIYLGIKEEQKLLDEIKRLGFEETVDMPIKTKGSYAKIERMIKEDYQLFYNLSDIILSEYEREDFVKATDMENYKTDGPLFVNTKKEIKEMKESITELNRKMLEITKEENINNRIKANRLDNTYGKKYKELLDIIKLDDDINATVSVNEEFLEFVDNIYNLIDYMSEHEEDWYIDNDKLIYKNDEFFLEYNRLVSLACHKCEA